jgi:hypothetical protein
MIDLSLALGCQQDRIRRILDERGIRPAYRVGRVRRYLREQREEISDAVTLALELAGGETDTDSLT